MTTPVSLRPPDSKEEPIARPSGHEEAPSRSTGRDSAASEPGTSESSASEPPADSEADLNDRLARSQSILRLLDRVWRGGATSGSNPEIRDEPADSERVTAALSGQIGRFDLVRELGRGGFGIVFLAVDPVLGRTVALKVPRPEVLITPELRDRFLREAQAAALLSHPNLVQVYEAGEIGPLCYIVSAYCPGKTLQEWLAERKSPVAPVAAARLVTMIANAVQHAHDRGILHRDLKPANILLESLPPGEVAGQENRLGEFGFVPKLTDFGLAKLLQQETSDDLTPVFAIVGTPAYMSPEQAEGRSAEIGPAADIYSLGAVLYELLTGSPPFSGPNDRSVIAKLLTEEVRPPSRLCRAVPRDLEAICLKCLEKQPAQRYKSAAALSQDLQCFLHGVPTQARPLGPGQRVLKWARRKPAAAALLGFCVASLLVCALVYNWHKDDLRSAVSRAEKERTAVEELRLAAAERENEFRRRYYVAGLKLAYAAYKSADVHQAVHFLEQQRTIEGQEELRGFVWHYLWRLCHGNPITMVESSTSPKYVAFSADGHILGAAENDGAITLWDMPGRKLRTRLRGHTGRIHAIAFSPDGETLASCAADRTVRLWNLSSGTQQAVLVAEAPETLALSFSRNGKFLAIAGKDANIELWDTATWQKKGELGGRVGAPAGAMSWSPDGRYLASGSDQTVQVWELDKPARARYEFLHEATPLGIAPVTCVAFSNDGRSLVSSCASPVVKVWDMSSGKLSFDLAGHTSEINFVQFSGDDRLLATVGRSGVLRVWDVKATRNQIHYVQAHAGPAYGLAFSPLDGTLVSAGAESKDGVEDKEAFRSSPRSASRRDGAESKQAAEDKDAAESKEGAVKLWNLASWKDTTPLTPPLARIEAMSFCARGRSMVCGDANGALHWYDVPSGALRRMNHEHKARIVKLAGSADGSYLASASEDGTVRIWDPASGAVRWVLTGHANGALCVSFSADSQLLASGAADGKVRIWHASTGQLVQELEKYPERVDALAFAPEGRRLAVGHGRALSVWNLEDSESEVERELTGSDATIEMIAWSKEKAALAAIDVLGHVYEWTAASTTAKPLLTRRAADERFLIFGNRGGGILTGDPDGNFSFWSFVTEQIVISLAGHGGPVTNAAFSLEGRTVATAGTDEQGRNQMFLWLSGTDPH